MSLNSAPSAMETTSTISPVCASLYPSLDISNSGLRHGLWDTGSILKYSFFGGSIRQHKKVQLALQTWKPYANIAFIRLSDNDSSADIRIGFEPSAGSWSFIGKDALRDDLAGKLTMNYATIADTDFTSVEENALIIHEFGHVLGMVHEHSGRGLDIDKDAAKEFFKREQGWGYMEIDQFTFEFNSNNSNYRDPDPDSIMLTFMPAELNVQRKHVPINTRLSDKDKAWIVINYTYKPVRDEWTLEHALDVAGVDTKTAANIIGEMDEEQKRILFKEYFHPSHPHSDPRPPGM